MNREVRREGNSEGGEEDNYETKNRRNSGKVTEEKGKNVERLRGRGRIDRGDCKDV